MIENAMAMVSSCIRRLSSPSGVSSPSMRSTGGLPTLRWRSEALRSIAILSRSLMFIAALLWRPGASVGDVGAGLADGSQDFAGLPGFAGLAEIPGVSRFGRLRCILAPVTLCGCRAHREQPAMAVFDRAGEHAHELSSQPQGDLARAAGAQRDAVHRTDGSDLGGGAGEEQLVTGVEQ